MKLSFDHDGVQIFPFLDSPSFQVIKKSSKITLSRVLGPLLIILLKLIINGGICFGILGLKHCQQKIDILILSSGQKSG